MPSYRTTPDRRIDAAVKAFKKRAPCHHSPAFVLGLRAVLAARLRLPVVYCNPYRQRTAKFDAFRAGCQAGNFIYLPVTGIDPVRAWTSK